MINNTNKITIGLSLLLLSSCADISKDNIQNQETEDKHEKIEPNKEGIIINFLETINEAEANIAKTLVDKLNNPEAKSFARFMIEEHTKNLNETKKISDDNKIAPVETDKVKNLRAEIEKELDKLKSLSGDALDKAYIDAMVKGHEDVLEEIDNFLKENNILALQKHLEATRHHVIHHLELAQKIQKELQSKKL